MIVPEIYSKTRALIFDLDGTLADSIPVHHFCWSEVCKPFGFEFKEELLFQMTGMPTRAFAEYIKINSHCNLTVDQIVKSKQEYFYKYVHTIKAFGYMAKFVKTNFGKIPMSIGTGGGRKSAQLILETIGLADYFPFIVTSDNVVNHKPAPDTFLKCSELMGISPQYCQVFEDGDKGIEAALTAGMLVTDVRSLS